MRLLYQNPDYPQPRRRPSQRAQERGLMVADFVLAAFKISARTSAGLGIRDYAGLTIMAVGGTVHSVACVTGLRARAWGMGGKVSDVKTIAVECPGQLHEQLQTLACEGWIKKPEQAVLEALRRFLDSHRPDLERAQMGSQSAAWWV